MFREATFRAAFKTLQDLAVAMAGAPARCDAGALHRRPIRPTRLRWEWLLCFGAGNDVGALGDDGVVLVSGSNAAGKTAFLETVVVRVDSCERP